ncbi:MAG TPA: zf-HC2 domain-containing protein [Vicinamibacterales bacterium]|nr:zf-HC2 domain-containing protein [Vicinamibacterales bacterium]
MKEIACASGVELLMDYLEGVLAADVRSALDAHVAGCPRCVAFLASYRETPRLLREATATELPADVQASLRAFLRAQRGLSPRGG